MAGPTTDLLMTTSKSVFKTLLFALLVLWFGVYATAIGNGNGEAKFTLNLDNAEITQLIKTVSEATGINFVVDPRVSGRVTVVSATPVDADKLYEMFLSVLQVHGFSVVPAGSVTKVVPDFAARQGPVPVLDSNQETRDQLVSKVIPIIHVPAEPLVSVLRPMVPQEGILSANPASNTLIVTDRVANIRRLQEIIEQIDVPNSEEVAVVRLHHASAADVVRTLSPLQRSLAAPGSPTSWQLVADDRMNSILITGNKALRERMRGLITALDSPMESGGNTRVVFLKFAEAEDIAPIISEEGIRTIDPIVSQRETVVVRDANDSAEDGSDRGEVENTPTPGSFSTAGTGGDSEVNIKIDSTTNSLIITALPAKMATILDVIESLDIRPPQVMVEAVIAEVSEDNIRELGINFLLDGTGNDGPVAVSNLNGATGRLANSINSADAGLPTALESGLSLALGNISGENVNFGVLFNAIASNADNNILSTPTIVTPVSYTHLTLPTTPYV